MIRSWRYWLLCLAIIFYMLFGTGPAGVSLVSAAAKKTLRISGHVLDMQGQPIDDVEVKLEMEGAASGKRSMKANAKGEYSTEVKVNFAQSDFFRGTLFAHKKGYEEGHEQFNLRIDDKSDEMNIVIRRPDDGADQLPLSTLIKILAPNLRINAEKEYTEEADRKEFIRGYELLMDAKDPQGSVDLLRKSVERASDCLECQLLLSLALMNAGSWNGANQQMEAATVISEILETKQSELLLMKGIIEAWRGHDKNAVGFFMKVVEFDPRNALVLQELGRAGITQRKWEVAEQFLSKALSAGAGEEARLMRARTLLEIGEIPESEDEMTKYVAGRDIKKLPQEVRNLQTRIQNQLSLLAKGSGESTVTQPIEELIKTIPALQGLEAAKDQNPLEDLLAQIGKKVEAFFNDIPNTSLVEKVHQERLNKAGKVVKALDQEFLYIMVAQTGEPGLGLEEYRSTPDGNDAAVGGKKEGLMITSGFASISSIFHPDNRRGTDFRYLGKQDMNGRDAFVIAFAMKPATAKMYTYFTTDEHTAIALVHGVAWVDAKSLSLIRLHTYLLNPLPIVRLQKLSTEIQYQEVTFNGLAAPLLLPKDVSILVDYRRIVLRNHHSYSDFKLFNIEAKEERKPISAPDRIIDSEAVESLDAKKKM
jgi:tetratricopeptide (TPR) repeat protein